MSKKTKTAEKKQRPLTIAGHEVRIDAHGSLVSAELRDDGTPIYTYATASEIREIADEAEHRYANRDRVYLEETDTGFSVLYSEDDGIQPGDIQFGCSEVKRADIQRVAAASAAVAGRAARSGIAPLAYTLEHSGKRRARPGVNSYPGANCFWLAFPYAKRIVDTVVSIINQQEQKHMRQNKPAATKQTIPVTSFYPEPLSIEPGQAIPDTITLGDILTDEQGEEVCELGNTITDPTELVAALRDYFETIRDDLERQGIDPGFLAYATLQVLITERKRVNESN